MINIKFDTSGLKKFAQKINKEIINHQTDKIAYLTDISRKTEVGVFEYISKNVYAEQFEPKYYQWTYNLMEAEAVETFLKDNKAVVYMNDKWLESQDSANLPLTIEKGLDPEVHGLGEPFMSYSERVEYGYVYSNINGVMASNPPRYYMAYTYNDLIDKIKLESESSPKRAVSSLIKGWSK